MRGPPQLCRLKLKMVDVVAARGWGASIRSRGAHVGQELRHRGYRAHFAIPLTPYQSDPEGVRLDGAGEGSRARIRRRASDL